MNSAYNLKLEKKLAIVHGDLYSRHLLVGDDNKLVGVIDWGDVFISNPAIDLVVAHNFLPPCAHEKFKKAYGIISDDQWDFARLRALCHSLVLVIHGHKSDDKFLMHEGQKSLEYIAEQISI